jgi:hypothetical protein
MQATLARASSAIAFGVGGSMTDFPRLTPSSRTQNPMTRSLAACGLGCHREAAWCGLPKRKGDHHMTDFKKLIDDYDRHRATVAKTNKLNKAAVFKTLTEAGITSVTVEFNGEGDSGQIEDITASAGETPVPLPKATVTIRQTGHGQKPSTHDAALKDAIETLCYDYLEQQHGGWENNDGAFGSFEFDVAKRTIRLEFNGRFTDFVTHNHDF